MADSTSSTASSAGKKTSPALVLGGIVIVFAVLAGIGWYLQGGNQATSANAAATQAIADANKAAADAAQAAAAAANAAVAQSQQAMAAANQALPPGAMQPPPPGAMQPPPPGAMQPPPAAGPAPMAAPAPGPAQKPAAKPKTVASKTDSSGVKSAPARPSATAAKVAECKRVGNLFERESCMWKACSNKWGKDGCPDYQKSQPSGGGG